MTHKTQAGLDAISEKRRGLDNANAEMDSALLFAGAPAAVAAFAKDTGLSPGVVIALLGINAAVNESSLTLVKLPTTIQ